jgi:ubiquinone/menaquinone biosynthesis C-methylase UbiE
MVLDLAKINTGDSVLDVGCGTGTLAIAAKKRLGPKGEVCGIDASPEMIARAGKKATRASVEVSFQNSLAESLPFSAARFDVVLSTVMLHHLPRKIRQRTLHEIRRVLKPGGRVLAVDWVGPAGEGEGLLSRLHRHGRLNLPDLVDMFRSAGLQNVESGEVGVGGLQFVRAVARAESNEV